MKFKKVKVLIFSFILAFSSVSAVGCSLPFIGGQEAEQPDEDSDDDASEEGEDEEDKEKEAEDKEGNETQTDSELDDESEDGWESDLILPGQNQQPDANDTQKPDEAVCTCTVLCSAETIHAECIVCTEDFHRCLGKAEEDPLDKIALPAGQTATAGIAAFGSNFFNQAVMNGTDKSYKYDYIYSNLKDTLAAYDVKIITQETVFSNDPSRYSGTAPYMSPPSIASALANAGFNVIASATDHAFDNGKDGVLETLNAWNSYAASTLVTGIHASEESYNNVNYMDVNGIRIAFLSYTSSLNGMTLTNEERTYVKTLYNEDSVAEDISYASKIADFVIVLPHWGMEGDKTHTANQEKWVQVFIDNGADLIIGTGSDVLQDVVLYEGDNGQVIPCYYSLGNLVSSKDTPEEVLSGAASITITKTGKETKLESYDMFPLALHVSKKGDYFQPYILSEYSEDTIKWHHLVQNGKKLSISSMNEQYSDTVEIKDINSYSPGSSGGNISIGQQQVTVTQQPVNTEQDNSGNPLVDDRNVPETTNPGTDTGTQTDGTGNSGLGNIPVIGG